MNSARAWRAAWAFAGSRQLSVFVLVMGITYALILAVFRIGFGVDERWLSVLADLLPYKLFYALFLVNLTVLGIGWVPALFRLCRLPDLAQRVDHPGRFEGAAQVPGAGVRIEALERHLMRRGYRCSAPAGDGMPQEYLLCASKGRSSSLGNLLFHGGFLLLLAGAVTNALYRFEGTAVIAEGGAFSGARKEYRTIAGAPDAALPQVDFDVERVSAEFWMGRLLFTHLQAQLLHRGGRDVATVSAPAQVGNATVTIAGYGYAPTFQFKGKDGVIADMATVKLNIISPGNEDYFYVPGYPHKIFVSFYPDHAEVDGRVASKSMNPVNPAYFVRILRGRIPVYAGLLKPGEWAAFDGLAISFPSFTRSGEFRIARNPGHPMIWMAFAVMGLGLAWRLFFHRKEVALWRDAAGCTWVCGRADYFPKLHAAWLASLADRFQGVAT